MISLQSAEKELAPPQSSAGMHVPKQEGTEKLPTKPSPFKRKENYLQSINGYLS